MPINLRPKDVNVLTATSEVVKGVTDMQNTTMRR
jgi:hypothetical protein